MNEITAAYQDIIGQSQIVQKRILSHSSFVKGCNDNISVLYTGEAGLGKSMLIKAEKKARAISIRARYNREPFIFEMRSPQEIRLNGSNFKDFLKACDEGDGIEMDELHELDVSSTVQLKMAKKILKDLLDGNQGPVRRSVLSDNFTICRDAEEIFFATGTNYPNQIKDGPAIISRFGGETPLSLYSEDHLTQILLLMAKASNLRINEDTVALIARCGRGTARPMEHIVKHLNQVAIMSDKRTINRSEAFEAMRMLSLFPCGLSKREVCILTRSMGGGTRLRDLSIIFAIETKAVNNSLSFLAANGFLSVKMGLCETTPRGAAYLDQLKREKFVIPTI